jgi:hypothetical protein
MINTKQNIYYNIFQVQVAQGSHTLGKTKKGKQPSQRHSAGNIECESLSRGNSQDETDDPPVPPAHSATRESFRGRSRTLGDKGGAFNKINRFLEKFRDFHNKALSMYV